MSGFLVGAWIAIGLLFALRLRRLLRLGRRIAHEAGGWSARARTAALFAVANRFFTTGAYGLACLTVLWFVGRDYVPIAGMVGFVICMVGSLASAVVLLSSREEVRQLGLLH